MHPATTARAMVGQVIQNARLAKGWSAEHAASQAGIAQRTWARVENGEGVRSNSLTSIARLFGLPDDALLAALSREHGYVELAEQLDVQPPGANPEQEPPESPSVRDMIRATPLTVVFGEVSQMLIERVNSISPAEAEVLRALLHYNSTMFAERFGEPADYDEKC